MADLQPLRADHASAVLDFELENRAFFAESISDRGDDYFRDFASSLQALLADQARGIAAFYVLVDERGEVIGRFNLFDITDGTAVVGYRVAQRVSRRGVATAAVRDLCRVAREDHAVQTLRAAASDLNVASQQVLAKAGFLRTEPTDVGGQEGAWYELSLVG